MNPPLSHTAELTNSSIHPLIHITASQLLKLIINRTSPSQHSPPSNLQPPHISSLLPLLSIALLCSDSFSSNTSTPLLIFQAELLVFLHRRPSRITHLMMGILVQKSFLLLSLTLPLSIPPPPLLFPHYHHHLLPSHSHLHCNCYCIPSASICHGSKQVCLQPN